MECPIFSFWGIGSLSIIGHFIILVFSQKNQNMLSYFFWKYVFNNELPQCTVNWKLLYTEFRIQKISDPMVVPNLRLLSWLGLIMSNTKKDLSRFRLLRSGNKYLVKTKENMSYICTYVHKNSYLFKKVPGQKERKYVLHMYINNSYLFKKITCYKFDWRELRSSFGRHTWHICTYMQTKLSTFTPYLLDTIQDFYIYIYIYIYISSKQKKVSSSLRR